MSTDATDVAEALVEDGAVAAFGVAGSGVSLDVIGRLAAEGVPFYDACHEAAAVLMAAEHGRQSGSFGLAITIKGPGVANALPGIVAASYEQRAVVTVSEAYADEGPRAHKRLDHQGVLAPAKAYATLDDAHAVVPRLVALARAETPGPVHLDLARRAPAVFEERAARPGGFERVADAASAVAAARRPVVIAGSAAVRAGLQERLRALRVPVLTTFAAKGAVDEAAGFAAGVFTGDGGELSPERRLLADADLVVGIGLRAEEILTPGPFPCPLVPVDAREDGCDAVLAALGAHDGDEAAVRAAVEECDAVVGGGGDWRAGTMFRVLHETLGADACLALDTGAFCTAAEHVWKAHAPLDVVASANGRFMGTGLPLAIGAALARGGGPVVCVVGDGGMRPYVADLKLVLDLQLPLLLVLATDGRYGSVAEAAGTARDVLAATGIRRPSWLRAVEGLGCAAADAGSLDAFSGVLGAWDRATPLFIEARFDPSTYTRGLERVR